MVALKQTKAVFIQEMAIIIMFFNIRSVLLDWDKTGVNKIWQQKLMHEKKVILSLMALVSK